jgi:ATP-dependent Clp protease ATP-binding subunit ClpA
MKNFAMNSAPLEYYGYNLTRLVQQGLFSPLPGYEACITKVFQALLQKEKTTNKYNPLLLDTDGISRWRIIIEIARRIEANEVPGPLSARQVIALNYEALFAESIDSFPLNDNLSSTEPDFSLSKKSEWDQSLDDSASEDMIESLLAKYFSSLLWPSLEKWRAPSVVLSRLQTLFLAIHQTKGEVLLFINHVHRLLAGDLPRYSIDASSLLKPILARREIQFIGACMPDQYQHYIERDAAISRRLQEFHIKSDNELQ